MDASVVYPENIIQGVEESLKQADEGKLFPFISIYDMLDIPSPAIVSE